MKKIIQNPKLKKVAEYLGWKILGTLAVVLTAAGTIWAIAAFTEPTSGPAASVQDFAKNIMGANNADNAFNSGSVVSNNDGSIIERLEALEGGKGTIANQNAILGRLNGFNALSARSSNIYSFADAANFCFNLSAVAEYTLDGSNMTTTYTDWRLPTVSELAVFAGRTTDMNYLWTASVSDASNSYWLVLRLSGGEWGSDGYSGSTFVRCVR